MSYFPRTFNYEMWCFYNPVQERRGWYVWHTSVSERISGFEKETTNFNNGRRALSPQKRLALLNASGSRHNSTDTRYQRATAACHFQKTMRKLKNRRNEKPAAPPTMERRALCWSLYLGWGINFSSRRTKRQRSSDRSSLGSGGETMADPTDLFFASFQHARQVWD